MGKFLTFWLHFTWVFLKFYLNQQFQNTVCRTYFNIQKQFDATIFVSNLSFCNLATVLATFPKIGQFCFQTSGHTEWPK